MVAEPGAVVVVGAVAGSEAGAGLVAGGGLYLCWGRGSGGCNCWCGCRGLKDSICGFLKKFVNVCRLTLTLLLNKIVINFDYCIHQAIVILLGNANSITMIIEFCFKIIGIEIIQLF